MAEGPANESDRLFGRLVVEQGLAKAAHVEECLRLQEEATREGRQTPPLGEMLFQRGYLTLEQFQQTIRRSESSAGTRRPGAAAPRDEALPLETAGGERVGKYIRTRKLGAGGMGEVWKAWDTELRRWVALKFLLAETVADPEAVERFEREVKIAAGLMHPNIVATHDAGQVDGRHFYVMEFIDGESLAGVIHRMKRIPVRAAFEIVRQMSGALTYAHERGLVHRDIKPANVLLTRPLRVDTRIRRAESTLHLATGAVDQVRAVLTDFGMAREVGVAGSLTLTGAVLGTPHYMAPEQARGDISRIDARSDIWAVGVCLYEMFSGVRPFQGKTAYEVIRDVVQREPAPLRRINPAVPRDAEAIVFRCLAKEPNRRYRTIAELAEDIDRTLNHQPVRARPVTRARRAFLWMRRNKTLSLTGAAGILGILLTLAWAFWAGPALKNSARRSRLLALEKQAASAVASERARLEESDPDTVIVKARSEEVRGRVKARIPTADAEEEAAVERGLARYSPGPLLSRAFFEKKDWNQAYRFHPSGEYGVRAQIRIAQQFAAEGRLDEAAEILRRVLARTGSREVLAPLAEILAQTGDLPGAAGAFAEAKIDSPLSKAIDALLEERQSFPIPSGGPKGGFVSREAMPVLSLERPTLVLPFRDGRPAFETRDGKLAPVASPLACLQPTDRIIDAATFTLERQGPPGIVVALERPGVGGGFAVLSFSGGAWDVTKENLSNITQPVALAVGDVDGDGRPEAVLFFKWESPEHWIVRLGEGRVEKFHPPGMRVWAWAPIIGDFGGEGKPELMLARPLPIGGQIQFFRVTEGARPTLLAQTVAGAVETAVALSDGTVAALAEVDPAYLEGEIRAALGEDPVDSLVVLRRRGDEVETVARHRVGIHEFGMTTLGSLTSGRLSGLPAIAFSTYRGRIDPGKRRAEGQRFRVVLGDPKKSPLVLNFPFGIAGILLRDLDGDGDSELLVATPDRLVVRGRRSGPVPPLSRSAGDEVPPREVEALLRTAGDLFTFESFEPARDVLAEVIARFPGTEEAAEAERLRIDALLRAGDFEFAQSERSMKEGKVSGSESHYASAMERYRQAAREAGPAAERVGARQALRRRLYLQAAEACRRSLDWSGYHQNRANAIGTEPGADDEKGKIERLSWLGQLRSHVVLEGDLSADDRPFVCEFPARLGRSGGALVAALDAHSARHVAGVPIAYPGGAIEAEFDLDLEGSIWSGGAWIGLVPRDPAVDLADAPGAARLFLHGTTRWELQGASLGLSGTGAKLDRYRGRWRVSFGVVPEAETAWMEVRDLDREGALVYRGRAPADRPIPPGRYVFGLSIGYEGGDALVSHAYHPAVTSLRVSRMALRSAHPDCAIERVAPNSPRDLALAAGERLFRGDRKGALDFLRRALERDATTHAARVHLALAGGTVEEFARGYEIDPYGFLLALDDALRGAAPEQVRTIGTMLRQAADRLPGPFFALGGDFEAALPHLRGEGAADRYLRRRGQVGPAEALNDDWNWLVSRSMRTAGNELPFVVWAPGPEDTLAALRAKMNEALRPLRAGGKIPVADALNAWAAVGRVLLVAPDDREALVLRGQIATMLGKEGPAERDWRRLTEVAPRDPSGWLLLAKHFARRRAARETLEYLESALSAGLERKALAAPEFAFLARDERFVKLRGE